MNNGILQQPGGFDGIFIESATLPFSVALGHSASQMTDSLAVYSLLGQLDSNATLATLKPYFEKASNEANQSLEKLLEGLSETILGTKPTITEDRESLYLAIKNLLATDGSGQPTGTFASLIGKVTIAAPPSSSTVASARDDFGAFLSLFYLTPFALKTTDKINGVGVNYQ